MGVNLAKTDSPGHALHRRTCPSGVRVVYTGVVYTVGWYPVVWVREVVRPWVVPRGMGPGARVPLHLAVKPLYLAKNHCIWLKIPGFLPHFG